jgi:hypothetical protein
MKRRAVDDCAMPWRRLALLRRHCSAQAGLVEARPERVLRPGFDKLSLSGLFSCSFMLQSTLVSRHEL